MYVSTEHPGTSGAITDTNSVQVCSPPFFHCHRQSRRLERTEFVMYCQGEDSTAVPKGVYY